MSSSVCRSCGAPIMWALTDQARMPLDAEPDPAGLLEIIGRERDGTPLVRFVRSHPDVASDPSDPPRYRSHFATCPHAAGWRRDPGRGDGGSLGSSS